MLLALSIAVITSGFAGIYIGYDVGVIGGFLAIPAAHQYYAWSSDAEKGFVVASFTIGGLVSSFVSGWIADRLGRRLSIVAASTIFLVGGIIQTASTSIIWLFLGRAVAGLATGITYAAVPVYTAEIAPKRLRGALVVIKSMCIAIGILIGNLVSFAVLDMPGNDGFRLALALQLVPAIPVLVGMFFSPSSPRWLMSRGRSLEAQQSLARLLDRPFDHPTVTQELNEIAESLHSEKLEHKQSFWRRLREPSLRNRMLTVITIGIIVRFSGLNALLYYAPDIYRTAGVTGSSTQLLLAVINGSIGVLSNAVGTLLVDRLGRKLMMVSGGAMMACCTMVIGMVLVVLRHQPDLPHASHGIMAAMFIFYASYFITWGPVTWVYVSEILPQEMRGNAVAASTAAAWLFDFIITQTTPFFISHLGGTFFLILSGITVIGSTWMAFVLRETKNKSLENINAEFEDKHEMASVHK